MIGMAEHMRALAAATGWSALSAPDGAGVYRVALEDNLDVVFFALGGRVCVMRGVVADLPGNEAEADALCADAARRQVAALRERPSVLALEKPGESAVPGEPAAAAARLVCFRTVPLSADEETFAAEVQGWLNDFSWWKAALGQAEGQGTGMGGMFGAHMFSGIRL
ncbi:MAG: hypothetical protein K6F46_03360 [Desulfovibrio sp.]|nr:hypothetical protein [Desulfovibrio sp.]